MMNKKQFQKLIDRDKACLHCGLFDDTLVVQHRGNRGMGGFRAGNAASNLIVLCAAMNLKIESNAVYANLALDYGWKISRYADPLTSPVYSAIDGEWYLLDDDFGRKVVNPDAITKME